MDRFRHEAVLYASRDEFLSALVPFVSDGVDEGEPVLIVESQAKIGLLREALGTRAPAVLFADMAQVGGNPARIIPAWRDFVDRHGAAGKRLRGIGEPIWKGRTPDELVECQRHESLLNVAFGSGSPWWLVCPYDVSQLEPSVIEEARRSHEFVHANESGEASAKFRGIELSGAPFGVAMPEPVGVDQATRFDAEGLHSLRGLVTRRAMSAGMSSARAAEFATAVNEIATNSVVHGGGEGALRMWHDSTNLVCEVRDRGRFDQPLADRTKPGHDPSGPRGLWVANQLCDLVQIRSFDHGAVIRLHARIDSKDGAHVAPESTQTH
jgi:anti-sigma regulatory factor (Ser/Thr protein kinase)